MKMIKAQSMADCICDSRIRKIKSTFLNQINILIDWEPISAIINKHYSKGKSAVGNPSYDGLLLFKMSLLQTWYGMSDYETEERINDSISFGKFCDLTLDQCSPDHSTLCRFRKEMTEKKAYDELFKEFNKQLSTHGIIVKGGAIVDASIIDTPLKPKGKNLYSIANCSDIPDHEKQANDLQNVDSKAHQEQYAQQTQEDSTQDTPSPTTPTKWVKIYKPGVDQEAAWVKKAGKLRYGYKKHVVTDSNGMILGVCTTPAHVNEISNLEEVLESSGIEKGTILYADKGYHSKKNEELLKEKGYKNRIMKKAKKGKPLSESQKRFNKLCSKIRYKVERTFGSIKRWFNTGVARYKGEARMHTQNVLESIAHNLYRSPGIIMRNCEKS